MLGPEGPDILRDKEASVLGLVYPECFSLCNRMQGSRSVTHLAEKATSMGRSRGSLSLGLMDKDNSWKPSEPTA